MEIRLAKSDVCTGCQACKVECPKMAITMIKDKEGFLIPSINQKLCVKCHRCENICPANNYIFTSPTVSKAIIVKSKNEEVRMSSSSGGIFSHLAEYIIKIGGYVVGAAFSEDFHSVNHIMIGDSDEIPRLRGSKYLQSDVGEIYRQVENKLLEDKYVLFSGTGCQIAGLRAYLKRDYEKLFLVDVVCHGVPSQDFWSRYLGEIEIIHHGKANSVNFRSKKIGWEEFGLEAQFGENVYFKELKDDPYLEIFQRNLSLRESCYYCKYKSVTGIADLSIGDLWGADQIDLEFNDNKGISFILINSNKGQKLIDTIKEKTRSKEIDLKDAIVHNRNIAHPAIMPTDRSQFFADLKNENFSRVLKKYTRISSKEKIKRVLDKAGLLTIAKQFLHRGSDEPFLDKNLEYGLLITFSNK